MNSDHSPAGPIAPFTEIHKPGEKAAEAQWEPDIDIGETSSAYVLVAEMPGVRSEHLNLIYESGLLTVDALAPPKGYDRWRSIIRDERDKGRCYRVFALPSDINIEGRRETLHHGLLTIHLPKLSTAPAKLCSLDPKLEERERSLPTGSLNRVSEMPGESDQELAV